MPWALTLDTAFQERAEQEAKLDPITAKGLHKNLSQDLLHRLNVCMSKVSDWPSIPLNKFEKRKDELEALLTALTDLNNGNFKVKNSSTTGHTIMTGIVSGAVMKLMASDLPAFNENEELVLDALRQSKNSLSEASDLELSNYVQSLSVEQIAGLKNNVKGIYHELAFQSRENLDGDEYIVELFENTNHLGADVRIINIETGHVAEVQLKATNYASYVQEHNEKYENIDVLTTSEVAGKSDWSSSGFSNEDLNGRTDSGRAYTQMTRDLLARGMDGEIALMRPKPKSKKSWPHGRMTSGFTAESFCQSRLMVLP